MKIDRKSAWSVAIVGATAVVCYLALAPRIGVVATAFFLPFIFFGGWGFGLIGAVLAWGSSAALIWWLATAAGFPLPGTSDFVNGFSLAVIAGWLLQLQRKLKRNTAALAESEARFRRLAEASFEGLIITDDGVIVETNDAYAKMMRVPRHELIGTNGRRFLDPAELGRVQEFRNAIADGAPPVEFTNHRPDGSTFIAEIVTRAIQQDGKTLHVTGIRDVTERKKLEEALRRNERLSALGTLVAGVAHEINNPLAYIRGNIELMQIEANDAIEAAPEAKAALGKMLRQSDVALEGIERIASITKSLKQVARASTRVRSTEDLSRLVANVAQIGGPRIPPHVSIELDLRAKRSVVANGSEIAQILLNLLFNAADATSERGSRIRLRTFEEGGSVVVEIEDDGAGIPLEKQAKLFTPFYTTKPQGTGLGLSVSRSIATDHGGDLTFVSKEGQGTTFRLALPAAPAEVVP